MKLVFWLALIGSVYSYALYPLLLLCLPRRPRRRGFGSDAELPSVTLIIAAHNEEARIERKIRNTLAIDYPRDRFEILIASDCSADTTEAIAARFAADGVRVARSNERLGKEHAQGLAAKAAKGEILAFTDTGTDIPSDGIREIVANFADERVGAASSEDRFVSQDGSVVGEGVYIRYEMWLRRLESDVNSLIGLSGSFFAVRKSLCGNWDSRIDSDFNSALESVRQGRIAVTDARALGIYLDIKDPAREYQRKVRTVIRGINGVIRQAAVLNPFTMGLFAWQVWSHKILRWAVPWFLLMLWLSNIALANAGGFYRAMLALQLAGYTVVLLGWLSPNIRESKLVKIPYYFLQANIAMAHALIAYVFGRRVTVWTPSKR